MSYSSDIIEKAKAYTCAAHASIQQVRKYTYEPYHVHCERVAKIVSSVTNDGEVIAAAWMHDVLEDVAPKNSNYNTDSIQNNFGARVLKLVLEVTDISKPTDGNRECRKSLDREHLSRASNEGKTIKLADLIDNYMDIEKHDKNFIKVFRREALLLLPYLKTGESILYDKLKKLLITN